MVETALVSIFLVLICFIDFHKISDLDLCCVLLVLTFQPSPLALRRVPNVFVCVFI